jgi:hypothetical protein
MHSGFTLYSEDPSDSILLPPSGRGRLENAFCAWDVVSSCPFDGLSDSKREGFKGRLGSGYDVRPILPATGTHSHTYLW